MNFLTSDVRVGEVKHLHEVWKDMKPLLEAHWKEVAAFQDDIQLNVWVDRYVALMELGIIRLWVCYDEHGMCGYSAYVVQPHLHYQDHTFANNDVIFISPELRGGELAYSLVKHCEDELKKDGVSVVTYHMKVYAPFHSLMQNSGYVHLEHLYGKKL